MNDEDQEERKPVEKVITGEVVRRKKSLLNRFTGTFFGDDAANVAKYVLYDVLIPAARDTMLDMVTKGFERLLFGDSVVSNRPRRGRDESIVSYGKFYRGGRESRDREPLRRDSRDREPLRISDRSIYDFEDIVIKDSRQAQLVINRLADLIDEYHSCSVADLYDMLGITNNYTHRSWGWDSMGGARVEPVRGGYVLDLPTPIRLD
jgi:hypothetical protein